MTPSLTAQALETELASLTRNYNPLPVVAASAKGAWVTDVEGKKYLDCLAAYSAVNFGHGNRTLIRAAKKQLGKVTLTSRAFSHNQLGPFAQELAALLGMDMVLPMNTGAEAVESAVKVARAWGYRIKGVPANKAKIIVAKENFHGRTISIVSFSTDESSRKDFGPFTPGFVSVPYGDAQALEKEIDANTVAVLLEPIQGEAGIIVPPKGYLKKVRAITKAKNVLMIADEIQSGFHHCNPDDGCVHNSYSPGHHLVHRSWRSNPNDLSTPQFCSCTPSSNRCALRRGGVVAPSAHCSGQYWTHRAFGPT